MHTTQYTTVENRCCEQYPQSVITYSLFDISDDDDYDIDFYTADPVMETAETQTAKPSPREQLEFLVKLLRKLFGWSCLILQ